MHQPVMTKEILDGFAQMQKVPQSYLDGTFGRGGHLKLLMEKFPRLVAYALDQDREAIAYGQKEFKKYTEENRLFLYRSSFDELEHLYRENSEVPEKFQCMLLDLGVSSPQLDVAERGFSFYQDGPLDMRMNQDQSLTAKDIVNTWDKQELTDLFVEYAEIKRPGKLVDAIIEDRKTKPFETTLQLAGLVERVWGWRRPKKGVATHPATKIFMALRLRVNDELEKLQRALPQWISHLDDGGRLAILTFHSLVDRIVKKHFKSSPVGGQVTKKVIQPTREEIAANPRSRSAKLRLFEKGERFHGKTTKKQKYAADS